MPVYCNGFSPFCQFRARQLRPDVVDIVESNPGLRFDAQAGVVELLIEWFHCVDKFVALAVQMCCILHRPLLRKNLRVI